MAYELPKLPYELDALEPHIAKSTVDFHYNKHTKKYFEVANQLAEGTIFESHTLEDVNKSNLLKMGTKLFNNVSQAWNHVFYWEGLTPTEQDQQVTGPIKDVIELEYGTFDKFKDQFTANATRLFGSGWTWLVFENSKLSIKNTPNASTPLTESGVHPLLVCDVWEHAYYLQHPADRPSYIESWWTVVNWNEVNKRLAEINK